MSLTDLRWDVDNCARCSMCKWVDPWEQKSGKYSKICPAVSRYYFDAYSSQGKMDIARAVMEGDDTVWSSDGLADIVYHCTLCGACDIMCKRSRDMEPLQVFKKLREKIWKSGKAPKSLHAVSKGLLNYDNVWMQPRSRRAKWAKGLDLIDASKEQVDVLLFVGCTYAYQQQFKDVIGKIGKALTKTGDRIGILGDQEKCCASPLEKIGDSENFVQIASSNIEQINSTGAKAVVTPCAGCYGTIKAEYKRVSDGQDLEMKFEVLHITEYLEQALDEGRLKTKRDSKMKVTYHDPCHLGRLSEPPIPWSGVRGPYGRCEPAKPICRGATGIYDSPRDLIQSIPGVELVEMERIRENSWCCGAGGGVRTTDPDFAQWAAEQRIEEAMDSGAEALVTSCPWCEQNLSDASKERFPILNAAELLWRTLE